MKHRSSRRAFVASAAGFASIAFLRSPAKAAQFQYKYGNPLAADHPLNTTAVDAFAAIKSETGGRLEIDIFPDNQLGGDSNMIAQLRSGALQFQSIAGGNFSTVVPATAIESIPFAFKNNDEAWRTMDGPLGEYIRGEILAKGLHAFKGSQENGFRQITSDTKPMKTVDDLQGFRLRTPTSQLFIDLFKTLGASPTPMNFNEVYTALQTHVIDGQENPYAVIETSKLYEVQKYLAVTNHMWSGFWFCANLDAWNALGPDIQGVVERNVTKWTAKQRAATVALNASLAAKLRTQGLTFVDADTAGMKAKLGPLYVRQKANFGDKAWGLLEASVGRLS